MRARGANATMKAAFETDYGLSPEAGYFQLPFVSSNLGEERGLIDSDLLGQGREMQDPTQDVAINDGDVVIPVDLRNFWFWLKLAFGDPATGGSQAATGTIKFAGQPAANSTITLNGSAITFVAADADADEVVIGATTADTVTALAGVLNASADANLTVATYASNGNVLTITHDTAGVAGNAYTLVASAGSKGVASAPTLSGGAVEHVFTSGASDTPSASIEIGMTDVGRYAINFGAKLNQLKWSMQRSGLLNATASLICQGESDPDAVTVSDDPTNLDGNDEIRRFAQASGSVLIDGVAAGEIVSADITFSNNLDKDEVIREDGRIGGADPAMAQTTGTITVKYDSMALELKASSGTPVALEIVWRLQGYTLTLSIPRTFLPRVKQPITGPAGVQAQYNFSSSAPAGGHCMAVTLTNDVEDYA